MKVTITPGKAKGKIMAPPSKSMAHRMLMGAGLAKGVSRIENIDLSEDVKATLGILKCLGCSFEMHENTLVMHGIGGQKLQSDNLLDCKESGSTLRFFIPLLLTGGACSTFSGAKRLLERPLNIYEDICREQKISFQKTETQLILEGKLQPSHYKIPGNISSQFVTGLLYALPLLEEDSVLEILPPVESKAYIEMTLEVLSYYGIQIEQDGYCYKIKGGQSYQAKDGVVEGDYSNAAFLDAWNLIGGAVEVSGLKEDSLQGDKIYKTYFKRLEEETPEMDLSDCPDLGPILMGMAAAMHGARFTGTRRLRIKESDRGAVMAEELRKFGIQTEVRENDIVVYPGALKRPESVLCSHNDHRIAMTLAMLCSITGGTIEGAEAVRKSFPGYYAAIEKLGISMEETI